MTLLLKEKLVQLLLIEDNLGDMELAKEALNNLEFEAELTLINNGESALKFLLKQEEHKNAATPDIIILDLNIPKINGKELLETLKNTPKVKRIPVILLSSSRAKKDVYEAYDLGANCYIVKPIDLDKYFDAFKQIQRFWFNTASLPPNR